MNALAPGIHPDVPMADYLSWPLPSNSALSKMLKSPAHARAYLDETKPTTKSLALGRVTHTAILEPERMAEEFEPEPDITGPDYEQYANPRNTKLYKEAVAAIEGSGRVLLKADERATADAMRAAVLAHPRAEKLIRCTGQAELSIVFVDPATGLHVKSRLDWHTPSRAGGAIVDLKTTRDASPSAFERAIFAYGYHRQAAIYLRGAELVGLPVAHYVILAVESAPPHGVVLYRLTDEAITLGATQVDFALARWAECERTGTWPGYTQDVVDIGLPVWADRAIERDLEEATL